MNIRETFREVQSIIKVECMQTVTSDNPVTRGDFMKSDKEMLITYRCGKIYDPLVGMYIDICEDPSNECRNDGDHEEEDSFYMGKCGLISAYFL